MATCRRIAPLRGRATRGLTLIELMIAVGISSLVMVGVVSLQYISARTIKELYAPTRSRSVRMIALNQIRFRLCNAKIGSCVVSDTNHRIQFEDPTLGASVVSEFYFNTSNRTLYYDADIANSDPQEVANGPINITFTLGSTDLDVPNHTVYLGTDAIVTVYVQTSSELAYANVDTRDGETAVYLRNP